MIRHRWFMKRHGCTIFFLFCLCAAALTGVQPGSPLHAQESPHDENSQTGEVVLNFDDADLYEVIRTFAEILNINYIADPGLRGKVTIHTAGGVDRRDLFPIFYQILRANGLTAVRDGNLYHILPLKEAPRSPIEIRITGSAGEAPPVPTGQTVIQIVPLSFISVEEITKILTPFLSADGSIISHRDSNTLLIVDRRENIQKALQIVDVFDVDVFGDYLHHFYTPDFIGAEEAAKTLGDIFSSYRITKEELNFIVLERMNLLMIISRERRLMDRAIEFLKQIDVETADVEPRIFIYSVKNGQAAELSELLNGIFTAGGGGEEKAKGAKTSTGKGEAEPETAPIETPFGTIGQEKSEPASGRRRPAAGGNLYESGTLTAKVKITPDEIRNVLIIEAVPRDYRIIKSILDRIDILPRQVLIEVTIAEIKLDAKTDLGVEWSYLKGSGGQPETSLLSASVGSSGLQYTIGEVGRWTSALSALATENKVNIISSPSVLASDNKEAKINISTEVPVASAQYQYDSGSDPIIQTNIQYRNTGVILSVTPHINEHGLVSMDISQEVSEQSESVQVGNESMPSFFKRSVNTSLTVHHAQTIVIGGLIRQNVNDGRTGVPCLGSIPGLEFLFGRASWSKDKTELIILITPQVIRTLEEVDLVTEEFKSKVGEVMVLPKGTR